MALQTAQGSVLSPMDAFSQIRANAWAIKVQAQAALVTMQAGSIDTIFAFQVLDQSRSLIAAFAVWKAVTGLDAYATAQGYVGSLVNDCTTCQTAAQAIISWITANFPVSGGFVEAFVLNADGSRTPNSFTTAQTAGLQAAMSAFIATIS